MKINVLIGLSACILLASATGLSAQPFDDQKHFQIQYGTANMKYDFDKYGAADFRKWQAELRAELKARLGVSRMEIQYRDYKPTAELKGVEDCGDFTRERWIFMTEPTVPLPMIVLRPKNLKGNVPLVIAIQGHSKNPELFAGVYNNEDDRKSGEEGERNVGVQAVREGYIAIVPTTRAFGETRLERNRKKDTLSSCAEISHNDFLFGRNILGERVWDCSRIIDWSFENLPVDKTNVIVTGNSGGGTATIYAGAIDTRISISMPGSAFCPYAESIGAMFHCDCNYIPGIMDLGDMQDVAGLTAPRKFRCIHGVKDHIFPIEATRRGMSELGKIYAAAGVPGDCTIYEGAGGHRYYKAGAWDYVRANLLSERPSNVIVAPEAPFEFKPLEMYVFPDKKFPITKFGARKGNVDANTAAFKKAMAACNKAGGGSVIVPEGEWITGPIHFLSNCNLHLEDNATILFTDVLKYFPIVHTSFEGQDCMNYSPLLYAWGCDNIAITGNGTITPKLDLWESWYPRPKSHLDATRQLYAMASTGVPVEQRRMDVEGANMRPNFIEFVKCNNVQLGGFKIRQSPMWCMHLWLCKDCWLHDIDISAQGHNSDGVDFNMTQHAIIERCTFFQADDALTFKAGRNQDAWAYNTPTSGVIARNCYIKRGGSFLAAGSELSGGINNVYVHHCYADDLGQFMRVKTNERRGGVVSNLTVEDCWAATVHAVMNNDADVMFQYRTLVPTFEVKLTKISGLYLRNCIADWAEDGIIIKGDARLPIKDVAVSHLTIGEVSSKISQITNVEDFRTDDFNVLNHSRTGKKKAPLYRLPKPNEKKK